MQRLLFAALVLSCATLAQADVLRCVDASGAVSYTNEACPASTRQSRRVQEPAAPPSDASQAADRTVERSQAGPSTLPATEPRNAAPAGPAIIGAPAERPGEQRWSTRSVDGPPEVEFDPDAGYVDPYARPYRRHPPRNLGPRIRNCDASGCHDTQGNTYDRSGRLQRYQSLDGRRCQPVGTTTVCR